MADGKMNFEIGLKLSTQDVANIKSQLQALQKMTARDLMKQDSSLGLDQAKKDLKEIQQNATQVQKALSDAFNPKLNTFNLSKLRDTLNSSDFDIQKIYTSFQKAGSAGTAAFNNLSSSVLKSNVQLRESHSILDKIGETMTNTIKWGITSRVINGMADAIGRAWDYTVKLDSSLNDIRIVTGKSAEEMERFAVQANRAAQNLGASTRDYTNAALIYYQQGLDDAESQRRAEITVKTANVTGQSGREASEQLTAIWNGYKVSAEEAELYIDKVAKVAAGTAADLEEMATGMSKVASAAHAAGVDIDQLNATLATVVSATREAPETIGSAFRTIYARLGDLKLGGTDEEGVTLGKVSGQLEKLGVQVLKDNGDMREMGDIVEDIAAKWQTWTRAQQQAAAVAMAGKMQYSRLIALFDNWDKYNEALEMSTNAMGELQKEQDIYMDSTKAHLQTLRTSWERVFDAFVDNKGINNLIDVFSVLTQGIANFTEAIGGGGNALLTLGGIATQVFSKSIAQSINATVQNFKASKNNAEQLRAELESLRILREQAPGDKGTTVRYNEREAMQSFIGGMNKEEIIEYKQAIDEYGNAVSELEQYNQDRVATEDFVKRNLQYDKRLNIDKNVNDTMTGEDSAGFERYAEGVGKNQENLSNLIQYIEDAEKAYNDFTKAVNENLDSQEKANLKSIEGLEELGYKGEKTLDYYDIVQDKINTVDEIIEKLRSNTSGLSADQQNQLKKIIGTWDGLDKTTQAYAIGTSPKVTNAFKSMKKEAIDVANAYENEAKASNDFLQKEENNAWQTKEAYEAAVKEKKKLLDIKKEQYVDLINIQNITKAIGLVQSLAATINTVKNLPSIWNDKDLSTGEKILQTVMAFSSVAMNAIPIIQSLTAARKAHLAIQEIEDVFKKKITASTMQEVVWEELLNRAKAEGKFLEIENIALLSAEDKAILLKTYATKAETAALAKAKIAQDAFNTSALANPYLWIAIAVVAAITGIVFAIKSLTDAYNHDAIAAKEAAEAARQMREEHEKLVTAIDAINDSINAYDAAYEKLKNCTKGTEEWKKAVLEVNEAVRDVLDKVSDLSAVDLSNLYKKDANGNLTLNDEEIQKLQKQLDVQKYASDMAAARVEYQAAMKQRESTITDLGRQLNPTNQGGEVLKNAIGGFIAGTVSTGNPLVGSSAAGAAAGATMAKWDQVSSDLSTIIYNNLNELANTDSFEAFKKSLNNLGADISSLDDSELKSVRDTIIRLNNNTNNASEKLEALSKIDLQNLLGSDTEGATIELEKERANRDISKIESNVKTTIKNMAQYENMFGSAKSEYNDLLLRLQAAGYTNLTAGKNIVQYSDDNRKLEFYDENTKQLITKSIDEVASMIATYEATVDKKDDNEKYKQLYSQMEANLGKDITEGLKKYWETGNLESLTPNQLEIIANRQLYTANGLSRATGIDESTIREYITNNVSTSFADAQTDLQNAFNDAYTKFGIVIKNSFESLNVSDLSIAGQKIIADTMNKAFSEGGKNALDSLTTIFKSVPHDEMQEFTGALIKISDWGNTSLLDLQTVLKESGVETQFTTESLEQLIEIMRQASDSILSMAAITKEFAENISITKNLKRGDIITADNYEKLSSEAKQYFQLMADGTYKLVGQADDLQRAIRNRAFSQTESLQNDAQQQISNLTSLKGYNLNTLSKNFDKNSAKYSDLHVKDYQEELQAFLDLEKEYNVVIDRSQTLFGNVDLNNKQILRWTEQNKELYKDIIGDWEGIKKDYLSYSTVMGSSATFGEDYLNNGNGIEIAFTPMLNTEEGEPILLSNETVTNYIEDILHKAVDDSGNLNIEKVFELDAQGLEEDGQYISHIIADIGDNARLTGELLHYLGENGSLETSAKGVLNYHDQDSEVIDEINEKLEHTAEATDKHLQGQLNVLKLLNYDNEQITKWQEALDTNTLSEESYQQISDAVKEVSISEEELNDRLLQQREILQENMNQWAAQATSYTELKDYLQAGIIDESTYGDAAYNLYAQERENKLDSSDVEEYSEYLKEIALESDEVSDGLSKIGKNKKELEKIDEIADNLAIETLNMNKAIKDLADNWKDWSDILKKSGKNSDEYFRALKQTKEALSGLLDISTEFISNSLFDSAENMSLISQAAEGDAEAIDKLRAAALEQIVLSINLDDAELTNDQLMADITSFKDQLDAMDWSIQPYIEQIDGQQDFVDGLNDMILKAGLTKDQVNALFSGMGYDVSFAEKPQKITTKVPLYKTEHTIQLGAKHEIPDGNGGTKTVQGWDEYTKTYQVGEETYEGTADAFAMQTSEPGTTVTPAISSISQKASSSSNNYSSQNSGGGRPGSSSGGGGGSSKPSQEKPLEKETDPYHDVNIQLSLINSKLKLVQSQTDKAFGTAKIENYNRQLQLLNQKLDQTKQKLKIAEQEQARLGRLLADRGAIFNVDGTLANYEQLYQQELAKVNGMIEKYNNMSKEEQEAYKDTLDQAKDDFSKFEEQLKDYDDTVSSIIPGLQQDIQDAIDEQIELQIKKFNMEFEIHLDMTEAHKDWNEFKKKILDGIKDDDIFGNARARAVDDMSVYLDKNGNGQLAAGLKQTQEVLAELRKMDESGWSSVYGDNRTKALEDLQTAYKDIEQSMLEIQSIQEDVHQAWLDTMDEINDKMSEQVKMYEQISNIIEHDKKVIELVYGETNFDALGRMYEAQHQNNLELLEFQRMNADFWRKEMDSIVDKNSEEWKKARDSWIDAVNDLNATIENSIENIRDKLENTIDGVFDKFNKKITNDKGLDYVEQQWDLINDKADDYLDTVNAAFGIRDLERKYQNAIDGTSNVSAQRKLNELMQKELNALRDKDKLTEYDIERAQKKYDLEVKRLALEEAQNAKTKMRLRRDSQGNYRYEYVADEDNIRKLQEEVDALENSLYNFDKERFISLQNEIVGYVRDREEAIKEIQMDASLTEEERQARLAEINQLYNDLIQDITDQTVTAQTNLYESGADELRKIWEQQSQDFNTLNEEQQKIMVEEMIPQFESGVHDMIEAFKGPDGFEAQTTESMSALSQATRDYEDDLREVQETAGELFDDIEDGIDKNIPLTEDLIAENEELHQQYEDQIDAIKELNALLDANMQKYKGIADAAKRAAEEAYNYWMTENKIAAEKAAQEKQNNNASTQINNPTTSNNSSNSGNSSSNNKGHTGSSDRTLDENTMSGIAGAIWIWGSEKSGWGTGQTRWARLREKFGDGYDTKVQNYINSHQNAGNWKDWNELKNYYYNSFKTGGYTGDWGDDDGKLAILHKKELVLNKEDTENMLNMMKIARDVVAAAGPNSINLNPGRYQSDAASSDILEQNVHIEANFPNVETAGEIEEALNNLVNLAAQRANYKRR